MDKFLHRVTLTGIDQYTNRDRLVQLTHRFPFVEWGVLLSKSRMGHDNRYPSREWIEELSSFSFPLSLHVCGSWARDFLAGGWEFIYDNRSLFPLFQRIQLNHPLTGVQPGVFDAIIGRSEIAHARLIVQIGMDGLPGWWHPNWWFDARNKIDYLFDHSGGRGELPKFWMGATGPNWAFAGGLTPDNLDDILTKFLKHAANRHTIGIDVESGVRTDDVFDLDKAERFLATAEPYVIDGNVNAAHRATVETIPISSYFAAEKTA